MLEELLAKISPKALVAGLVPLLAAVALYLVTGDETYLVGVLVGLVAGGGAAAAPPAPGVKQRQVKQLQRR